MSPFAVGGASVFQPQPTSSVHSVSVRLPEHESVLALQLPLAAADELAEVARARGEIVVPRREVERQDPQPADDPHRPSIGGADGTHNRARYLHRVTRAFVGLGSNLGDRKATLRQALDLLAREPGVELRRVSTFRPTIRRAR